MRALVAVPVFNEDKYLGEVLEKTLAHPVDILVVDDGSTDATPTVLAQFPQVHVIRHTTNQGYGATLRDVFQFAKSRGYDVVITMDGDKQHEPSLIPQFLESIRTCDIVSGSRYLKSFSIDTQAPVERQRINALVTDELNACLKLGITDSFCGFKAYRVSALRKLEVTEDGYGMPLELWVQAACQRMLVRELAVPRVYVDFNRSFGVALDESTARLAYYQEVIDRAMARARARYGCGLSGKKNPQFQVGPSA
jgi:dolichol-phosphate mannosyltransferase